MDDYYEDDKDCGGFDKECFGQECSVANPETRFPAVPNPDPDFCPPCECPEAIAQPRFASPRSDLPREETEELERCINAINDFLQTIGNPREGAEGPEGGGGGALGGPGPETAPTPENEAGAFPNNRGLQLALLRKLRGTFVQVHVFGQKATVLGAVIDAGRNYLQVDRLGKMTLIPFDRIKKITRSAACVEREEEAALRHIDACFRRALVLDFGNVVGCSPELANLFFGITLSQKLTALVGHKVVIVQEDNQRIRGTVFSADGNSVQLQVKQPGKHEDKSHKKPLVIRNIQLETVTSVQLL